MPRSTLPHAPLLSRRHLLLGGAAVAASSAFAGSRGASRAQPMPRPRTVILLELKGGNDGLNLLPPVAHPRYRAARPALALDAADVFAFDGGLSLHGAMRPLADAVHSGDLAAVVGVGYAHPNRSHFRSIEIWDQACDADDFLDQGWLTRVTGEARARGILPVTASAGTSPLDGVVLHGDDGPLGGGHTLHLQGKKALKAAKRRRRRDGVGDDGPAVAGSAAAHILATRRELDAQSQALAGRVDGVDLPPLMAKANGKPLPPRVLATMETTARLAILGASGDHSVPVVKLTLPGFDTHTNQRKVQDRLFGEVAGGLSALRGSLMAAKAWDDTVVVVMSEFGRRVEENRNGGTDHGAAAPVLVLGGGIKGGLHGAPWNLDDLLDGDIRPVVSHRDVFAAVAAGAFGLGDQALRRALPPVAALQPGTKVAPLQLWRA